MISAEQRAEIRRLFYAEHWKAGTIAKQLLLHRDTVLRAIGSENFVRPGLCRPSALDAYRDFIEQTLKDYPTLTATRIHEMLAARGYGGSVVQTRRAVRGLRPRPTAEAFLRLSTLPGEQAQVDWGHFGKLRVGRAERHLMAFVMILTWSRAIHVLFTLDAKMDSFLRGHVEAFDYFGGSARTILYDNLKSAVLERRGELIRYNPRLLELSAHYHFKPQPCAPGRGNEKGGVERSIRFLRQRFFAARNFTDVHDLNRQFVRWRAQWAHSRPCPGDDEQTIEQALDNERGVLLPLPEHPFPCEHIQVTKSGKTPYVRFDSNDYSIPHELVRKPLTLAATHSHVRILDGDRLVAEHRRSWSRKECIEDKRHIEELSRSKRAAARSRAGHRLTQAVPAITQLLELTVARNMNIGSAVSRLMTLLDIYGAEELSIAVEDALAQGSTTPAAVEYLIEQRRRRQGQLPPIPVDLSNNPKARDLRVPQHKLENYDALIHDDNEQD